jgi:hypothetical protein
MSTNSSMPALLLALAVAGVAHAQTPPAKASTTPADTPKIDFITIDRNTDGRLSKEEAAPVADLQIAFSLLDADGDDSVSPTEFSRWKRAGKVDGVKPPDPATTPSGSAGAQHMPATE